MAQTYIIGLAQQLWGLNKTIRTIYQGIADAKEMVEILVKQYEIKDSPDAKKLLVKKGEIVFKDVVDEKTHHTTILSGDIEPDYQSVIGFFAQAIMRELRLFGCYDICYRMITKYFLCIIERYWV